ncbi:MAG: hypothetical protein U0457_14545 [Candidatus Sericytochromatia bacterium]
MEALLLLSFLVIPFFAIFFIAKLFKSKIIFYFGILAYIGILFLLIDRSFTSSDGGRSKIASVKSNMHTFQTIVETYSVDYSGVYAKNVEDLNKAATTASNPYWKDFINPFTGQTGQGKSFDNISNIAYGKCITGAVYYDPIITKPITKYFLYGCDKNGSFIKDAGGNSLTLSNN